MVLSIWKKNSIGWGLLVGMLLPLLGVVIYYYWQISPNSWQAFFTYLKIEKGLLSSLTVVCLVLNIAALTGYLNTRRDETAKGIFIMTVLYGIASLLVKMLG